MPVLKKHQDPIGNAVKDYMNGITDEAILVRTDIAEDEHLPAAYFLRNFDQMPSQEQEALKRAEGRVLDIGAGAGAHSLWLQEHGFEVDSIDISPFLCEAMRKRGIKNVLLKDIYDLKEQKYDTILLLMNGAGVAQTLSGLERLLTHLKDLLNPGVKSWRILLIFYIFSLMKTEKHGSILLRIPTTARCSISLVIKTLKAKHSPGYSLIPTTSFRSPLSAVLN